MFDLRPRPLVRAPIFRYQVPNPIPFRLPRLGPVPEVLSSPPPRARTQAADNPPKSDLTFSCIHEARRLRRRGPISHARTPALTPTDPTAQTTRNANLPIARLAPNPSIKSQRRTLNVERQTPSRLVIPSFVIRISLFPRAVCHAQGEGP